MSFIILTTHATNCIHELLTEVTLSSGSPFTKGNFEAGLNINSVSYLCVELYTKVRNKTGWTKYCTALKAEFRFHMMIQRVWQDKKTRLKTIQLQSNYNLITMKTVPPSLLAYIHQGFERMVIHDFRIWVLVLMLSHPSVDRDLPSSLIFLRPWIVIYETNG